MRARVGDEILYRTWNAGESRFDSHFAVVAVAPASPHGSLNLFWGTAGSLAVGVENIENWDGSELAGNDHWVNRDPFPYHLRSYPKETVEVFIGSVITLRQFDATETEFVPFNAVVQAVIGAPNQDHPTVNLTYYDSEGKHNQNQVVPAEDLNATSGGAGWDHTDHWINHPAH